MGGFVMRKNKFILLIILVLLVSVFTMGCTDSGGEKEAADTVDNSVEKNQNNDIADVDELEEDDDDHSFIIGGEEWPTEDMDDIPQIAGKITSVSTPINMRHIEMESVKRKDVMNFIEDVKALGFAVDIKETNSDTTIVYVADHEDGRNLTLRWYGDKEDYQKFDIIYTALP